MSQQIRTADRAKAWLKQTRGDRVTLGALGDALGERGFGFLLLALTLPNVILIPSVPILPLIPGIPAMILCGQMALGWRSPALPGWAARLSVRKDRAAKCIGIAGKLSAFARPRMPWLAGRNASRVLGAVGLLLTAILCLPIPGLNIIPGLGVLIMAIGLAEDDGLLSAIGVGIGLAGSAASLYVLSKIAATAFGI